MPCTGSVGGNGPGIARLREPSGGLGLMVGYELQARAKQPSSRKNMVESMRGSRSRAQNADLGRRPGPPAPTAPNANAAPPRDALHVHVPTAPLFRRIVYHPARYQAGRVVKRPLVSCVARQWKRVSFEWTISAAGIPAHRNNTHTKLLDLPSVSVCVGRSSRSCPPEICICAHGIIAVGCCQTLRNATVALSCGVWHRIVFAHPNPPAETANY